jgi:hypothetical protein
LKAIRMPGTSKVLAALFGGGLVAAVAACAVVSGLTQYDKELPCTTCADALVEVAPSDGAPPSRCPHLFCATFDGAMPSDGWTNFGQSNGATLLLDTQLFRSSPASLKVAVPTTGGDVVIASLSQTFDKAPMHVTLSFDLQLDQTAFGGSTSNATITFASILAPDATSGGGVSLAWQAGAPVLLVSGTSNGKVTTASTPLVSGSIMPGTWTNVTIDATFAGASGNASVSANGMTVGQMMNVLTPSGGASTVLQLGLEVTGGDAPALDANFDNVAFDAP